MVHGWPLRLSVDGSVRRLRLHHELVSAMTLHMFVAFCPAREAHRLCARRHSTRSDERRRWLLVRGAVFYASRSNGHNE